MVTSEGRRSLRFGTDSLWDLSLVLQKEIHDLFTVTFGNSWAIGMCARMNILFISFLSTTKSAILLQSTIVGKKQSVWALTIMTLNVDKLCLFVTLFIIMFCTYQPIPLTLLQNYLNILSRTWGNEMFMRNKMDKSWVSCRLSLSTLHPNLCIRQYHRQLA